jgi:hypothetical protein
MTGAKNHKPLELKERKNQARFIFPRHDTSLLVKVGLVPAICCNAFVLSRRLQILGTRPPRMTPGGVGRFVFQLCRAAWFIFPR